MSKIVDAPVTITTDYAGHPVRFAWRNKTHVICDIVDEWRYVGCWWEGEGEQTFYRLQTKEGLYEVYFDQALKNWRLYRVYD